MTRLHLVGASLHRTPRRALEAVVDQREALLARLGRAKADGSLRGAVLLTTCHRVEVLLDVPQDPDCFRDLLQLQGTVHHYQEERAIYYLLRIACGLDSFLVGEEQITGQIRRSFAEAEDLGLTSRALVRLKNRLLEAAKDIRKRSGLCGCRTSLAAVAARHLTTAGPRLAVVGAGSTGQLALEALHRQGVRDVVVFNRTLSRAHAAADRFGYRALPLAALPHTTDRLDGALFAASSPVPLLNAATRGALRLCLDLCLPSVLADDLLALPDLTCIDIAGIGGLASKGAGGEEAARAMDLVKIRAERLIAELNSSGRRFGKIVDLHLDTARHAADELLSRFPQLHSADPEELLRVLERGAKRHAHYHLQDLKELVGS